MIVKQVSYAAFQSIQTLLLLAKVATILWIGITSPLSITVILFHYAGLYTYVQS